MKLILERCYNKTDYCIGNLYYIDEDNGNKKWICNVIEDTDRRLDSSMEVDNIKKLKVYAKTAIPTGKYQITLNVVSPKFSKKEYYKRVCDGRVPRLLGIKGYDGVLIHKGNTAADSAGCLIVGYNKVKGKVIDSTKAFEKLYKILKGARYGTEIQIIRNY